MSLNSLSSVLEKQIRRLCLSDFPCGHGSWRKTAHSSEGGGTEEVDALLDLLSCSHSPWMDDESWSPQAAALRRLAVLSPERLRDDFVYTYFTTLRIVDRGVSVIDEGVLKFSKLEELVLTANKISEIPAENLPTTLRVLELRANCLSALDTLTSCPPPHLHYLGLGSNGLRSHEDISRLTGRHWSQLVCLDLSDCKFRDQRALLEALRTLPSLRTLLLQGNPFTLASCYPGLTVDSLPRLSCLDASWISPEERCSFRGLAKMSGLIMDQASVTVSVGRVTGIPDPLMSVNENTPVVTYNYSISYEFLSDQTSTNLKFRSEYKCDTADDAHVAEDSSRDADIQTHRNCDKEMLKRDTRDLMAYPVETCHDSAHVSRHSTTRLPWSECMDFGDTQMYIIRDLGALKRFLNRGLHLSIEEEKALLQPAVYEDDTRAKTIKEMKGRKGKETSIKSGSTKEKAKDKKKMSVPELHTSSRRILGSVHVPLKSLVTSGQHVDVLCDFGALHTESEELGMKIKVKQESKCRGGSGSRQNTSASKGKGKGSKEQQLDVITDDCVSVLREPATLELRVELEKWQSASEAHQLQLRQQDSKQPVLA